MRLIISTAVVAAAALGAAPAEAAVAPGAFAGRTTAKDPVGITVGSASRVTSAYFEGVHMTCTDKDQYDTLKGQYRMHANGRFRIASSRKFTVKKSTNKGASTWSISGRFASKGTGAAGTLSIVQRFNIENQLDPKGSIRCESGKVKLTVARR
jgi:hypothetical protein